MWNLALRYGDSIGKFSNNEGLFVCASDASFGDNTLDRRSSQGYVMKLFGGAITWKANKQDTVTTSSTEAELLALSQTAKELIFTGRLLKDLGLQLPTPLTIECDNKQTIRLIVAEAAKLSTKLRHIDIHRHWLRQEYAQNRVNITWVPTRDMIADGLTKALGKEKHQVFINAMNLEDIRDRINREIREEELRDQIRKSRDTVTDKSTKLVVGRDGGRANIAGAGGNISGKG